MLASLNFVERFITLPKVTQNININSKNISTTQYDLEKIAPLLTRQGFEVDSIQVWGAGLETVVVGYIEKIEPHPTAGKLQICQVNVGEATLRQIVCGAPNARADIYVAVALPSTKLPNGLEIKPSKIRDAESNGMLCARDELGLPTNKEIDGDGIWELDIDSQGGVPRKILENKIGYPIFYALNMTDTLLELSVTPNRPDMLCHEGVARELMAGFTYAKITFIKKKDAEFAAQVTLTEENIKADAIKNSRAKCGEISFTCENHLNIPAFFVLIDSIEVKPSPAWLRNQLEALGQNSINNIVDTSNYVLLAYGQPNHAFDLEKLSSQNPKEKQLILRNAKAGEKFIGLDSKERSLYEADEIVADIEGAQAILGVLGGEHSKVSSQSKKIVVEFANPNAVSVRRTSRRHGRQTDASFLFEKGVDVQKRYKAALEFFALISAESKNKPHYCSTIHSVNAQKKPMIVTQFNANEIEFNSHDQEKVLGANIIPYKDQLEIIESLGFTLKNESESKTKATVPSWRSQDIAGNADLVEEFIRIAGIDLVPSASFQSQAIVSHDDPQFAFNEKISSRCSALGYNEVISLHFMRADDHAKLSLNSINSLGEPVALINPIIGDEPLMHTTLIPDLLRKVSRNISYGIKSGQLFHSCRTFQNRDANGERIFNSNGESIGLHNELTYKLDNTLEYHYTHGYAYTKEESQTGRPVETPRLAGICFGNKSEKTWQNSAETLWSLHDIMAHVQEISRSVGVEISFARISDIENNSEFQFHPIAKALHPGRRVSFYIKDENNKSVSLGWAGELHPNTMRNFEIEVPCYVFELNIAILMHKTMLPKEVTQRVTNAQKFPTITRDFAFLLDEKITGKDLNDVVLNSIKDIIKSEVPAVLNSIKIFDIYRGKGMPENKKSVAFQISLEPTERTFTEKDILKLTKSIINNVTEKFNAELRGV
ncbi:phenylalanine--tRNA ligase subunit beta [Fluviispira multicolorata]|uniref:Phenylalanine--tRNA ligase beta subunit n=1 Tax=Fluviispira multicolorata TaxID=2654512 RepID=A0A833JAM5_9BACT|nr:phenylalanine--tRNA ligase subunit beta [Fluviispira multicolorata]KAB8028056.1 phenylalanine--tRNA ligase subunit beta [Fluviispira multicolorata]